MSLENGATVWINIAMNKIFYVTTPFIQQDSRGKKHRKAHIYYLINNKMFIHMLLFIMYMHPYIAI